MRLDHVRRGSGRPLLLVHGIGGSWLTWEPLLDRLAAERDAIAVDLPGFGGSDPLPRGVVPTPAALAEAVAEFARETLGPDPVDVAGHSLGGWIALELAKLGVAARATAVAPAGFWEGWETGFARGQLRLTAWLVRGHRLDAIVGRRRLRPVVAGTQFGDAAGVPAALMRRQFDALRAATRYDETLEAMTARRFEGGERIAVPVSILWGTRDGLLLPPQAPRARDAVPGAELTMLRGAAHFAHWDRPEPAVRALLGS